MNINEHFFSIHFYTIYINIMLVLMKYEDKLIVLFIIV